MFSYQDVLQVKMEKIWQLSRRSKALPIFHMRSNLVKDKVKLEKIYGGKFMGQDKFLIAEFVAFGWHQIPHSPDSSWIPPETLILSNRSEIPLRTLIRRFQNLKKNKERGRGYHYTCYKPFKISRSEPWRLAVSNFMYDSIYLQIKQ